MSHRSDVPRIFLRPAQGLEEYVEFGFIFAEQHGAGLQTGLFCEGPQSKSFHVTGQVGEIVGVKLRVGGMRALLASRPRNSATAHFPSSPFGGPRFARSSTPWLPLAGRQSALPC